MLKTKISESVKILEAMPNGSTGEKVFKVILISEGLGNRHNLNYYGPEAITSAVKMYEGRWCFLNHQDQIEEQALPERDIRDKAGWYAKLGLMTDKGVSACAGELHCDLSESGRMLAEKLASALAYKKQFTESESEYCGLSVNGDGDAEKRDMTIDGIKMQVNYVTQFTVGESCDLVTSPARGGRGLAVLKESQGRVAPKEENIMEKALNSMKSALALIRESLKSVEGDAKKKLSVEAQTLEATVQTLEKKKEDESSEAEGMFKKKEEESESAFKSRLSKMKSTICKAMGENDGGDEEDEEKKKSAEAKKPDSDTAEAKREAVTSFMAKSGLPKEAYSDDKISRLSALPYREAKAVITDDAKLVEATRIETAKALDIPVASLRGGVRESAETKSNDESFQESFKKEKF